MRLGNIELGIEWQEPGAIGWEDSHLLLAVSWRRFEDEATFVIDPLCGWLFFPGLLSTDRLGQD